VKALAPQPTSGLFSIDLSLRHVLAMEDPIASSLKSYFPDRTKLPFDLSGKDVREVLRQSNPSFCRASFCSMARIHESEGSATSITSMQRLESSRQKFVFSQTVKREVYSGPPISFIFPLINPLQQHLLLSESSQTDLKQDGRARAMPDVR